MEFLQNRSKYLIVIFSVLIFSSFFFESCSSDRKYSHLDSLGIIPKPLQIEFENGAPFSFDQSVFIESDSKLENEKLYLEELMENTYGINIDSKNSGQTISLKINEGLKGSQYHLSCKSKQILIEGGHPEAVFHGITSLHQSMSIITKDSETPILPSFDIQDSSKFQWRGMLLDCCRHYFHKDIILKYIDLLAFYKFNTLHWHITEDQAWRIAIDAYPKLTEIGAWREDTLAKDGELYGGYYTKEDVKEIVKYASERHIQIVPEIEMPGHSSAAISAYPELGCTGEQISVPNDWGVFKDIYCPTENTFEFLETVLGEIMELFPSDYVHIGGDEAPKTRWEESDFCKELMKSEGLHDHEELQSYFINRMANFLSENGKTIIGWDEILNDELTESAIIQSWRGMDGGKKAISEGRSAIMSPTSHCYLDYSLKSIDTEKIYSFNPIPPSSSAEESKRILGAECNMWTEHVPDEKTLDSKVFPRLIAASEAFWGTNNDYNDFLSRLDKHYDYLDQLGVLYGEETVPVVLINETYADSVKIACQMKVRDISAVLSSSHESQKGWTLYPTNITDITLSQTGQHQITAQATKKGLMYEKTQQLAINVHSFLTAKVQYESLYSEYYTGGGNDGLTDGVLGSLDFRDGHWQGFFGDDVNLIIENPNEEKTVSSVSINFYRYINSWIFPPESITISISEDGQYWSEVDSFAYSEADMHMRGKEILTCSFPLEQIKANYLKVSIKNIGQVPDWHEASSEPAWVFVDEVIVN